MVELLPLGTFGEGGAHIISDYPEDKTLYPRAILYTFLCHKIIMFLYILCSSVWYAACEMYCSVIIYSCVP